MPLRFIKPCCFFKIRLQSSKSLQDKQRRWKQCVIKRKVTGGTDPSPMVCCGLQWLFDSKQSRKRQHRQQRQPRKKKTGKRQTQGDRVTGWQGEAARQSTVEYSCDVSGATLACRLQEATSHQQGMPMPHLHTTCIALQDTQLASFFSAEEKFTLMYPDQWKCKHLRRQNEKLRKRRISQGFDATCFLDWTWRDFVWKYLRFFEQLPFFHMGRKLASREKRMRRGAKTWCQCPCLKHLHLICSLELIYLSLLDRCLCTMQVQRPSPSTVGRRCWWDLQEIRKRRDSRESGRSSGLFSQSDSIRTRFPHLSLLRSPAPLFFLALHQRTSQSTSIWQDILLLLSALYPYHSSFTFSGSPDGK